MLHHETVTLARYRGLVFTSSLTYPKGSEFDSPTRHNPNVTPSGCQIFVSARLPNVRTRIICCARRLASARSRRCVSLRDALQPPRIFSRPPTAVVLRVLSFLPPARVCMAALAKLTLVSEG